MNYFKRIIELFTADNVSASGKEAFYKWISNEKHTPEKQCALKELWQIVPEKATPDTWQSFDNLKEKAGIVIRKKWAYRLRIWQAAAAVLLLVLLSSIYFYFSNARFRVSDLIEQYVSVAEMEHITLPDGSEVQLNSKSVLFYPNSFDGKTRSVYLMGEANFKVVRNIQKPFIVKSSDFQVTVLGTEFNVAAYPEDSIMKTTVLSGSVKVAYNKLQSEITLSSNQQLAYNKFTRQHTMSNPDIQDVTAWQRGVLVFEETTLREIITVLERRYPYTFTYSLSKLKNDKYTFRFYNKATLTEVMDIIVRVVGDLQYKMENDTCVIY